MAPKTLMCLIFATCIVCIAGNEFLKATPKLSQQRLSESDIRSSLLEEIEGTLGAGAASSRLGQFEKALKPIYIALPKNQYGQLGHATVRYALHRVFVLRHGWNIKGLGSNGGHWNASSPTGVLTDQVPAYIQDMLEKRLGGKGFGLHELAVLAATIEHLIHSETISKLGDVFNVFQFLPTANISALEAEQVLDTYMMAFILGENLKNMTAEDASVLNGQIPDLYVSWRETQQFVRDVQKRVAPAGDFNFAALGNTLEVVGEEFGTFQDAECRSLKRTLVQMEDRNTGRIKLADFYKPALGGNWQFQESVGYLRQVGALDETGPEPSVMIPNYLYSQANCIATSGYYSVCCMDECEGLLGHIEEQIAASEASTAAITRLVANLTSSTVPVPRQLSANLHTRLDDIAGHHGGSVPLHGRLFAQWMHHAFPRECPYPHLSGTTSQPTADAWFAESGADSTASEEEMLQFINSTKADDTTIDGKPDATGEIMPWSAEEELLVVRSAAQFPTAENPVPPKLRSLILMAAAGSLAFGMVQSFKSTLSEISANTDQSKFVV